MRRFVLPAALLAAALAGLVPAGCTGVGSEHSEGNKKRAVQPGDRLIILTNGESPFWDAGRQGMEAAAKDLELDKANLKIDFQVNDGTEDGQLDRLRQFASQSDVAAIAISVTKEDNAAIADQMRQLRKKGVHVLTTDSDTSRKKFRDAREAYIGTDNQEAGRQLGRCLKLLRPGGGEYVTFVGFTSAQNAKERVDGFAEGAGDKFKRVDNMGDEIDRNRAKENVRTAMTNHPNLAALVGIWSYNAPAIVGVLEDNAQQKEKRTLTVVAFDAEPIAIKKMGEGWIDAMAVQNPYDMGYQSTKLMKALVLDDQKTVKEMLPKLGQEGGDLYDTGLKIVVPDKGTSLKPETFDDKAKNVKGYKLSDFQEWMKKYNLTGS
ncbi:MAG TPA: substrate-binding domain-containing protein [Gemmataceae bacterium]|nr:substrate-binding domain-containing protein [Gemmataceae bacterium]